MDSVNGAETTPASDSNPPPLDPKIGSLVQCGDPRNLVDLYLEYSKDVPSPSVFRLWTAIHAVGAAAERRVWTSLGINRLHPNLFIFLVGPPGTGKSQAINPMSGLLRKSQSVGIAPNDLTKQGLLDSLRECSKGAIIDGRPFDYHYMAICISELSNFMSKYDQDLTGLLTDLFDCPAANEEKKRTHNKGAMITSPGISFIMGTATENLGNTIADEMWGSGFMARVIMVFAAEEVIPEDMFAVNEMSEPLADEITTGLRRIGQMKGEVLWEPAARIELAKFRKSQKDGAPLHNRLATYVTRRWLHLAKLCMISALADERLTVEGPDFAQAHSWLLAAESQMPEIFKDMIHHEDGQIYEELRHFMFNLYLRLRAAIPHATIVAFLSKRVGTHNIERMVQVCLAADFMRRVAGTEGHDALYVPTPPNGTTDAGVV